MRVVCVLLRYLKQKSECDRTPTCEMGGFTRLLHSGQPDDLMDEVPTFVAQPLPESVVPHEYYPVLNRPYALLQWVQQANITEEYVMMSEPDHIFLLPLINFMKGDDRPAAFPFFYIEPHKVGPRRLRRSSGLSGVCLAIGAPVVLLKRGQTDTTTACLTYVGPSGSKSKAMLHLGVQ